MIDDGFAFSEVVRKLANLIRIGKVAEIDGASVKVKVGRVVTGWLPIVSTAGDTTGWIPIAKDEQVVVFAPYGELTQAFVLRAIHYDNFSPPEEKETVSLKTKSDIKVDGEKKFSAKTNDGFEFFSGNGNVKIRDGGIEITAENAHINMSSDSISISCGDSKISVGSGGINLSCGSSSIDIGSGSISLSSGSISTNPPVCKCSGGL